MSVIWWYYDDNESYSLCITSTFDDTVIPIQNPDISVAYSDGNEMHSAGIGIKNRGCIDVLYG